MLKTVVGDEVWLIEQPDHARVSGFLAAHWGGVNGFTRPVEEAWGEEFILAVAQHDNGWWEWEACPQVDAEDGWPLGLADIGTHRPDEGLQRWRLGIPRFAEEHPLAALLVSLHAYHLYAYAFESLAHEADDALRHPLFGASESAMRMVPDRPRTRQFLEEQRAVQAGFLKRVAGDPNLAEAASPENRHRLLKLLQVFDALSLLLAFHEMAPLRLDHVPRAGWDDRVTIDVDPVEQGAYRIEPYPFDTDPLEVRMPARVVRREGADEQGVLSRIYAAPLTMLRFEFRGRE